MVSFQKKYLGKSKKYKYVYKCRDGSGNETYDGIVCKTRKQGFLDERKCALWVDKMLLSNNKEPVNILVRK